MIILLSPSKSQDFETPVLAVAASYPQHLERSQELIDVLRCKPAQELMQLMGVSEKIAQLNVTRYQNFTTPFTPDNAKPCVFAFTGDVYDGLEAASLGHDDLQYAQQSLRILSGLYGLLRPLDLIQPYRLEMGVRLANAAGRDLYAFWKETLTAALAAEEPGLIVNLASQEYAGAVKLQQLNTEVVSPVFKDNKGGQYKIISFYAKRARGLMARWLLESRVRSAEEIIRFDRAGYHYDPAQSSRTEPVFIRD